VIRHSTHRTWVEATNDRTVVRVKCHCGWRSTAPDHNEGQKLGEAHKEAHRLRQAGKL